MRILFAHPADVAYADQAAAALTDVTVRLRRLVPLGRMYLIAGQRVDEIRYGFELEQQAEQVIGVKPSSPLEDSSHP
jgi:hypothetical protein